MHRLRDRLLATPDDLDPRRLPPRFAEAQSLVRAAIRAAEKAGIADATVIAALVSEAIPRLVGAHGPGHASRILATFARSIAAEAPRPEFYQ